MKIIKLIPFLLIFILSACMVEEGTNKKIDKIAASEAYVRLGLGHLEIGELGEAKVPLKEAIRLNSKNSNAYEALALVFQAEKFHNYLKKRYL